MSGYADWSRDPFPDDGAAGYERRRKARGMPQPVSPTLAGISAVDHLAAVFARMRRENGAAPGPDGVTYDRLSRRELFAILRGLSEAIRAGRYRPGPARRVAIPKAGGGSRTLTVRGLLDRVVARAAADALTPVAETVFLNGSHGFRPARSHLTLLADLERAMETGARRVLVNDDVRAAFDSVEVGRVVTDLRRLPIDATVIDRLLAPILQGDDPARRRGIDQGSPLCPLALNVHLHHAHDVHAPASWFRYADNLVVACHTVDEGAQARAAIVDRLAAVGLHLKGGGGPPVVDLRRASARLLGFGLFGRGDRVRYRLTAEAWAALEQRLLHAHEAEQPARVAQAAADGWLAAHGPAFAGEQRRTVARLLELAARCGFRELGRADLFLTRCRQAFGRWVKLKARR